MTTHSEAKTIVDRALPDRTPQERLFLRAQALFESHYGDGWNAGGRGSNNWGAITTTKQPWFDYGDSRPTASGQVSYTARFAKYETPEDGVRAMAALTIDKKPLQEAIAKGDLLGACRILRGWNYYLGTTPDKELAAKNYCEKMRSSLRSIASETGESWNEDSGDDGAFLLSIVALVALVVSARALGEKRKA